MRSTLVVAAVIASSLAAPLAHAQGTAGTNTAAWRDSVRSWCGDGTLAECRGFNELDPGLDGDPGARAAFTVANSVVHSAMPLLLDAVERPRIATTLRDSAAIADSASAGAALLNLRDAYTAMLPARGRAIARRWRPEAWWTDAIDAPTTPAWRSAVRDGASRVGMAREAIVLVAQSVAMAMQTNADATRVLDAAAAFSAQAIERGAPRNDVIRAFMRGLQEIPRRERVVAAPAGPPEIPTREQVIAAMDAIRPAVERCVGVQDVVAQVRFVFESSGSVTEATVLGALAGSLPAGCIRTVANGATVPPFTRPTFSVSYPFNVRRASGTPSPPAVAVTPPPPSPAVEPAAARPIAVSNPEPAPAPTPQAPEPTPEPTTQATPSQQRPSESEIASSMAVVEPAVRACVSGRRGVIAVTYIVSSDGLVQHATATGPFDADARACIEGAVMNAQFPRFTLPTVSLTQRFPIRGR